MTLATSGADLFDGEAISLVGVERALRPRVIKRSEAEIDRERLLDDRDVALTGPGPVLLPRAANQFLVERHADPSTSHALKATAQTSPRRDPCGTK